MNVIKSIWGLLFRLFPCPTAIGLRRVGNPGRNSPVLVTCNFHNTVQRLVHALSGLHCWVVVAQSKGVNVWCAAGGEEFNTSRVVAAVKTSGMADRVDHRVLILPPLGGPGINVREVARQTGWTVKWGPVRAGDLPAFLAAGMHRTEAMRRVTYNWLERLDTGLGCMFPFYALGALGFWLFGPGLLLDYLVVGAVAFAVFFLACPWLPGERGLVKVIPLEIVLGLALLLGGSRVLPGGFSLRADLVIAMVMLGIYATELGGLASTMKSDLDPFMARLGIAALGNVSWAGTVRTDLLNGVRVLACARELCIGCGGCVEICPMGVWELDDEKRAVQASPERCTACRACLVQCPGGAITARSKTSTNAGTARG